MLLFVVFVLFGAVDFLDLKFLQTSKKDKTKNKKDLLFTERFIQQAKANALLFQMRATFIYKL